MRILPKKQRSFVDVRQQVQNQIPIFFPATFKYLDILHALSSKLFKPFISTCRKIHYSIFGRVPFEHNARYLKFKLSKHANNIDQ